MPYSIERYKKMSNISRIIDRAEQVDDFAKSVLNTNNLDEDKLLEQIKRNTNSIKTLVEKFGDKLQRQQF